MKILSHENFPRYGITCMCVQVCCDLVIMPSSQITPISPPLSQVCDISGGHILTKVITHAEMTVVKRCGHALSLERPKKTSYLIRGFIQKHLKMG